METRNNNRAKAYVYLVGHGLLILGFTFFTVGFATDHWLSSGSELYGLWVRCLGQVCVATSSGFAAWMIATRAMQTMALISYMVGVLLALFFNCVTQTVTDTKFSGKARVLEVFTIAGNVLCLIGVSVYGAKGDASGGLEYSYILTVFSLFLSTPGIVMVAVTRNAVTSYASVAPQPQQPAEESPAATTTITSSQIPQQPHALHGRDGPYPYGGGQHNVNLHPSGDGYGTYGNAPYPYGRGGGDVPFPYGHGGLDVPSHHGGARGGGSEPQPAPPYTPQQPLPYSMHPERPGDLPTLGPVPMPELGPIGGGGGREGAEGAGGGGGYGLSSVQPQSIRRLPPISNVAPSAPPPPADLEQPPSYMEATGHNLSQ